MALVAVSIAPSGTPDTSLSEYVAVALREIAKDERVNYRIDSMFTTLEGELEDCFDIILKMHEALAEMGVKRIGSVIKVDDRRDKAPKMDEKVSSVMKKM